jgi:ribonuclease HI
VRHLRKNPVYFLKDRLNVTRVIINADGASRGNPGPAAIGATIKDENGDLIEGISRRIGIATNNQAEYRAIITALDRAVDLGAKQVVLKSDSELVVNQIKGRYKIKNTALRPLYQQVVKLAGQLERFQVSYIPRNRNSEADALANKALDSFR